MKIVLQKNSGKFKKFDLFVTSPRYVEDLLAREIQELGGEDTRIGNGGVACLGTLETAYRICLYSRVGNNVLMPLASFQGKTKEEIYEGARGIPWLEHFTEEESFSIVCTLKNSCQSNSNYCALLVKDAVADYFREHRGARPSVESTRPDIKINIHIERDEAVISLDLSGESLHRRGYRTFPGKAALKENVAAAILLRAGWDKDPGMPLFDPMCGSGTFLVEGAFIAGGIAPGIHRKYYSFLKWKQHDKELWESIRTKALQEFDEGLKNLPPIFGSDIDRWVVSGVLENIEKAGLSEKIQIRQTDIRCFNPSGLDLSTPGLVVTNPPYGVRLGEEKEVKKLYETLGRFFIKRFEGWKAVILAGSDELSRSVGLRVARVNHIFNGPIKCVVAAFNISEDNIFVNYSPLDKINLEEDFFANRIKKNRKHIGRWARKNHISCYRLYDADIPEYSAAIDFYEDKYIHLQEYKAPSKIDEVKAAKRVEHMAAVLPKVLNIPPENVFIKQRKKSREQYEKVGETGKRVRVNEAGLSFWINLEDYLDTGLFLNNRFIREKIGQLALGRRFLNLFCYTGTATVHAAAGGALFTTSVDMSNTYLAWTEDNLKLNKLDGPNHQVVRADCVSWLKQNRKEFDLIFLDPPTFSNSKKKDLVFDLQKDHLELVEHCMRVLAPEGHLIFSNNFKKFMLSEEISEKYYVKNLSFNTLPEDFKRNKKIHHCWEIRNRKK